MENVQMLPTQSVYVSFNPKDNRAIQLIAALRAMDFLSIYDCSYGERSSRADSYAQLQDSLPNVELSDEEIRQECEAVREEMYHKYQSVYA